MNNRELFQILDVERVEKLVRTELFWILRKEVKIAVCVCKISGKIKTTIVKDAMVVFLTEGDEESHHKEWDKYMSTR